MKERERDPLLLISVIATKKVQLLSEWKELSKARNPKLNIPKKDYIDTQRQIILFSINSTLVYYYL